MSQSFTQMSVILTDPMSITIENAKADEIPLCGQAP